jgi:type I restriction enzyme M protein
LFEGGVGADIRRDLMDKCNLHTILRLPTGIFYAQGVKTNVLFFTRGKTDVGNTKEVWVYDLRTNMPSFGKRNPLTREHFEGFIKAYTAKDRRQVKDERWNVFTREEIVKKGDSLDIGLIADESLSIYENLPDPIDAAKEAVEKLELAISLLNEVIAELIAVEQPNTYQSTSREVLKVAETSEVLKK